MGYIGVVSHLETIDPNKPNGTSKQWCPAIFFWDLGGPVFLGPNVGKTRRLFVGVVGWWERGVGCLELRLFCAGGSVVCGSFKLWKESLLFLTFKIWR